MKKLLITLLLAVTVLFTLVACAEDVTTTTEAPTTTAAPTTTTEVSVTTKAPLTTAAPGTNAPTTTVPKAPETSAPVTTLGQSTPETPTEKTLKLDPKTFASYPAIVLNKVVENAQYDNEFTFQKEGSYMTSSGITGISKIVVHVFGTYDNLKMYQGTSASGTLITATVAEKENSKEYTYTFNDSTDAFYLTNPSTYAVHVYSITVYYTGTMSGTAPENPSTPDTPSTPVTPPTGAISIRDALEIGAGLSDERGTTDTTYTVTGVVTSIGNKEVTITDDGSSIICYLGSGTYSNLYLGYTVTVTGKIQNYYGTIELVYFTVDSFTPVTYTATVSMALNGLVSVSKTSGIKWGETVTVTATPNSGYKLAAIKVNGVSVTANGNTAEIKVEDNITVTAEFVTEDTVVAEKVKTTYDFSTYTAGTQYATETHKLDATLTMDITKCHLNKQLRIYDSGENPGIAVFTSATAIHGLTLNMGYRAATLEIYGSKDGVTYEKIGSIATESSYKDYSIEFEEGYKYVKLDAVGAQIRVATMTVISEK